MGCGRLLVSEPKHHQPRESSVTREREEEPVELFGGVGVQNFINLLDRLF